MKNIYKLKYLLLVAFSFSITSAYSQYCTPLWGTWGCTDDDDINNFSTTGGITNITNNGTGCSSGSYSYINNQVLQANPGSTVGISVANSGIWNDAYRIWVDWNNDFDFSDPGESVWNSVTASTTTFTGSFVIPVTAVSGINLRMRVRCDYLNVPVDPCATQTYGEVEDYNLLVSPTSPNDAGINAIVSPVSDCAGSNQNVIVQVKNYGINQINSVEVHWTLNSIAQPMYTHNSLLDTANGAGPNTANVTIGNITLAGGNPYNIVAWAENPNNTPDPNDFNDTSYANVVGYNYPTVNLGMDTSTCPNDLITLNAGTGRDSVRWNTNATTQTIVANTAQTYSVTVWKNGCSGTDNILVNFFPAPPPVDLGNDTMICYGDNITLNATAPGVTYLWHDNTTGPTHIADTAGNYSVTIEDGNTCKNTDDINISLFATPLISMSVVPRNTLCFGAPFEFRANSFTQGSTMYQWKINTVNFGAPTTNNKFSPTLVYGDSVNVELLTDVCNSTTFAVPSNYITMFLNPKPKLINGKTKTDTVLENTSKNYLLPIVQGSTFTWSAVGGSITNPNGNAVAVEWGPAMTNAKILVTEKDAGNCSYTNERNVVIISIVGVKDENNIIGIGYAYPNPANTTVTIPLVINGNWNIDLSLYDISGKKVKAIYTGEVTGNMDFTVSINELQNGIYFYKVSTSDGYESVKKLSIEH